MLYMYDVPAQQTRHFHKLLSRYLEHRQFSVFAGELPLSQLITLRAALGRLIREGDRVVELVTANRHNVEVTHITKTGERGPVCRKADEGHRRDLAVW